MFIASATLIFLALHLPYLPASLEDVDSINFALGMRHFDVAHHQPHPPGYPVFILAAKGMRAIVPSEPAALGTLSVVAAAVGLVAIYALCQILLGSAVAVVATLLTATAPLYWFTAARPLSDSFGLAAALAVQALILRVRTPRGFAAAAFLAGLAAGIRSQIVWLTVPLLFAGLTPCATELRPSATHGRARPLRAAAAVEPVAAVSLIAGILLWFIPLVALSGGPTAYWHALFDQGAEDLSGIRMLWTSPTPRTLAEALYYAFVAPWAAWLLAVPVLALAVAGSVELWRRHRSALAVIAVAFVPYLLFDIVFQETFTVRYALPLVVPVALCAAAAIAARPQGLALPAAVVLAMYGAHIGGRSIAAYSRQPAPAFRLLADMRAAAPGGTQPVLAPDRRASFDLRRPMAWLGSDAPAFDHQLAAPPQHEWREAVKYWNSGGGGPVWFVVDPRRAAMDLIQHGDPRSYRYTLPFPALMSGTRPADMDWYRVESPEWYVGDGWSLTPEAAGVSQELAGSVGRDREAWIRRDVAAGAAFILGGRNFGQPTTLSGYIGNPIVHLEQPIPSGSFLIVRRLSADAGKGAQAYVPVSLRVAAPIGGVAFEQFDVSSSRGVLGFGPGWHEREFDPSTGQLWRWLSGRGELPYLTNGEPATLRIRGETPLRYYRKGSRLIVRGDDRILFQTTVADDFTIDVEVPPAVEPRTLIVETDQTHVPAERSWRRSADRRTLGLRVFSCVLLPSKASAPGTTASSPPAR